MNRLQSAIILIFRDFDHLYHTLQRTNNDNASFIVYLWDRSDFIFDLELSLLLELREPPEHLARTQYEFTFIYLLDCFQFQRANLHIFLVIHWQKLDSGVFQLKVCLTVKELIERLDELEVIPHDLAINGKVSTRLKGEALARFWHDWFWPCHWFRALLVLLRDWHCKLVLQISLVLGLQNPN